MLNVNQTHLTAISLVTQGSGKTLAYGLPILHYILSRSRSSSTKRRLRALILAPTRELALQVSTHLSDCIKSVQPATGEDDNGNLVGSGHGPKKPPLVSVAAIVGGMSSQKQRRILDRGVDVLVATPGRLWEMIEDVGTGHHMDIIELNSLSQDEVLAGEMKSIKFLVLDEADRMVEAGHFAELDNIIRLTLRNSSSVVIHLHPFALLISMSRQ